MTYEPQKFLSPVDQERWQKAYESLPQIETSIRKDFESARDAADDAHDAMCRGGSRADFEASAARLEDSSLRLIMGTGIGMNDPVIRADSRRAVNRLVPIQAQDLVASQVL